MRGTTTIELDHILPADTFARLQAKAEREQLPLTDLIRDAIETYLDDEEFEETPDEEIEAGFLQGWHEVMTGKTRPAADVLAEIQKALDDDDES